MPTTEHSWPTKTIEYAYDDTDRVIDVARKDEQGFFFNTTYAYDNAGRVTNIKHYRDGDAEAFTEYGYGYDQADRIVVQTTGHDTTIGALSALDSYRIETFIFDEAGQLTDVGGLNANPENFAYDKNGNRTTSSSNGDTNIGDYNRLESDADWDYTYDPEGNLTRKTAKVGGGYTQYSYDHRNRLTSVEDFDSYNVHQRLIEYSYDADNRLVSKMRQLFWTQVGPMAPGYEDPVFEHYINQGSNRALLFDNNDHLARRYVQGPISDELLFDEVFDVMGQETGFFAPATDHLGTVRAVLNEQEAVHQAIEYNAFGEVTEIRNATGNLIPGYFLGPYAPSLDVLDTVFGFAGRPVDIDTGLSQNNARWYDPHTGRFLSEDPIQDGANWYRYAGNDPINFRDPTGLSQAGNPLNALAGGYSGGVVGAAPKPINFNTSLLASPTVNYNSSKSSYAYGPVRSTNTLSGLGNIALRTASSTVRNYNPIATSVVNAGLGLGAATLNTQVRGLGSPDSYIADAFGGMLEAMFGGRSQSYSSNARQINRRATSGGVVDKIYTPSPSETYGGAVGGAAETVTLRQFGLLEPNPSNLSRQGMQVGEQLVPVLAPGNQLYYGTDVTNQPINRGVAAAQLALEIAPIGLRAAAEIRLLRQTSRFPTSLADRSFYNVADTGVDLTTYAPVKQGFGGLVGRTADETNFLNNAKRTFGDGSVFTSATRHQGNVVIQRSDIPVSVQNLRRMQNGNSPFVRNPAGEWEALNLHHVGRQDGKLIEVLSSHNTYNPTTGGPLHIPGPGGPLRQSQLPQTYWQQRLQGMTDSGQVPQNMLQQLGR